jgi:hypothetical protein
MSAEGSETLSMKLESKTDGFAGLFNDRFLQARATYFNK